MHLGSLGFLLFGAFMYKQQVVQYKWTNTTCKGEINEGLNFLFLAVRLAGQNK